jgi:hypothetical protein
MDLMLQWVLLDCCEDDDGSKIQVRLTTLLVW